MDPFANFETTVLANGLTIYASYWPNRPWEAVGVIVHSGASVDPSGLEGVAHFVEHLVSRNTVLSREQLEVFFATTGGEVGLGLTGFFDTTYSFFTPLSQVARALDIFGQMLLTSEIKRGIELERGIIQAEFHKIFRTQLEFELELREQQAVFAGHWLAGVASPIGGLDSISKITRRDLQSFYDTNYCPANMSLVAVGGLTLAKLVGQLKKSTFSLEKAGIRNSLPKPVVSAYPLNELWCCHKDRGVGSYKTVAKIPGDIDYYVVRIFGLMLASLLDSEIREKKSWVYEILSAIHCYFTYYSLDIECPVLMPEGIDKIDQAVSSCIQRIGRDQGLFGAIKKSLLAELWMIDCNAREVRDRAMDELSRTGKILSTSAIHHKVKRVQFADVKKLVKFLGPKRRWRLLERP